MEINKLSYNYCYAIIVIVLSICNVEAQTKYYFNKIPRNTFLIQNSNQLELNKRTIRKIHPKHTHTYNVELEQDQFLQVVVEQKGIDVLIKFYSPDKALLSEFDGHTGTWGIDKVSWIAKIKGNYIIEIVCSDNNTEAGEYEVYIKELRNQTVADKRLVEAEKLFMQASKSREKSDKTFFESIIKQYSESISIYNELKDIFMVAQINSAIGQIYSELNDYEKSLRYHAVALSEYQKGGYLHGEATEFSNLGTLYDLINEKEKSIFYNQKALSIYTSLGDKKSQIILKNNIAYGYDSLAKKNDALRYYLECLDDIDKTNFETLKATILSNVGVLYGDIGDTTNALISHTEALKIYAKKELKREKAITLSNIGIIYDNLGEQEEALKRYDEAIFLFEEVGSAIGKAKAQVNKAVIFVQQKQFDKSKELYESALEIFKKTSNKNGEGSALTKIAELYLELNEYNKAVEILNHTLTLRRSINDRYGEAQTLLLLGKTNFLLGKNKPALGFYEKSLIIHREISYTKGEIKSLYEISYLLKSEGKFKEALEIIENCIDIIELTRSNINSQNLRLSYFASTQQCYELCINVLMALQEQYPKDDYYARKAFNFSERFHARAFLELLAKSKDKSDFADKSLLNKLYESNDLVSLKIEELLKLKSSLGKESEIANIEKEISGIKLEIEEIELQIKRLYPQYSKLTQAKFSTVNQIQKDIVDDKTLLLEYFLGKESSFCWAITQNSFHAVKLPSEKILEPLIDNIVTALQARGEHDSFEFKDERKSRIETLDKQYFLSAIELSKNILFPIKDLLSKDSILIVCDGKLNYVPFAVLPFPYPEISSKNFIPLILNSELTNLPSVTALIALRETTKDRIKPTANIAIFADPVFSSNDPRCNDMQAKNSSMEKANAVTHTVRNLNLVRLPATRKEAETILDLFNGGTENLSAFDFDASLTNVINFGLHKFQYIHFATHNFFNNQQPEFSGVLLSLVDKQGLNVRGLLSIDQIFKLNLSAELVVLSACQTGVGKYSKGEGILGFTHAFMQAGAKRTLVTMWNVDDTITAKFMTSFYEKLTKNLTPAKALQRTQAEFLQKNLAPYYWGAFILQGEPK